MFDARTKLSAQVGEQVRQHFPEQTLVTLIPRSVRLSEAPSYGTTILGYDPQSVGAKAYVKAAGEIARRGAEEPVRSARRGWPQ
jgi:chromosome partitioning protein